MSSAVNFWWLFNPFKPNIHWTSPFSILGLLGGIFHFYTKFKELYGESQQTQHFVVSYLVLYCLPMSHKKDARFIWVKC